VSLCVCCVCVSVYVYVCVFVCVCGCILGLCFLGFGMFSSAGDVLAEEWIWKIHVPVELKEIPEEAESVNIMLTILDNEGESVVDSLSETVSIGSGGNLSKVVTFRVYPSDIWDEEGRLASEATKYRVHFSLVTAEGEDSYGVNQPWSADWAQAKPGTEYVNNVVGPFDLLVEDVGALLEIYQASKK